MGKSSPRYYIKSKAKTFYKDSDYVSLMEWVGGQIKKESFLLNHKGEFEPSCNIKQKYVITVKEIR